MPRPSKTREIAAIEEGIADAALRFATEVASLVRQGLAGEIVDFLDARVAEAPAPLVLGKLKSGGAAKRKVPAHCVYPGCKNPHKGPRFSFLCAEHRDISRAEKEKITAAARGGAGKALAARRKKK